MLNNIILQGRLTRDPEFRMTKFDKPVASFTVACEREYAQTGEEKETDFVDCCVFGKTADFVRQYFSNGSMILVQGRLQFRSWIDKDEQKHTRAEIAVDRVWFGESKKKDSEPQLKEITEPDGELPF